MGIGDLLKTYKFMKNFSLHAILPCFLLLAFSILQASAQQAVLNRPVTVAVQDGTFSEAAGQIERQTGLMTPTGTRAGRRKTASPPALKRVISRRCS